MATHREIIYVRAPDGMPDASCFRIVEAPMPSPAETIAEDLESAPAALVNMLSGGNIGKQVVRLAAAAE